MDICKYCSATLLQGTKPRITFCCSKCKYKHYRNQEGARERINQRVRNRYDPKKNANYHQNWKKNKPDKYQARIERCRVSIAGRFQSGKCKAKRFGQEWSISKEQLFEIIKDPCHYCHGPLNKTGSGLDRVDNSRGYSMDNVLPCCKNCNRIKGDILSYEEMVVAMQAVLLIRSKKNGQ